MRAASSTPGFRRSPAQIHSDSIARIVVDTFMLVSFMLGMVALCFLAGAR